MARTLARCIMTVVLIAAYIPLPAAPVKAGGRGGQGGHDGLMACCAPKACCNTSHVCASGGECGGPGASHRQTASHGEAAAPGGVGLRLIAGGCGDETPRVTPHQLDPTVAPRVAAWMHAIPMTSELPASDARGNSIASRPLVPPPRA